MAAVLVGLLFLTGVLLLLVYQPSTEHAYSSVQILIREVPFGLWVRNIHHWSANLLVIIALLHLLRIVLTGAFGPGRRLNWIIGLVLLFLLLSSNFTGYLLPWDQLAFWAVTICTSMLGYIPIGGLWLQELFRGGSEIGPATLANFFVLHVAIIPATLLVLLLWHFWLVRRAGGLIRKEDTEGQRVPTAPNLIVREAAVGLALVATVMIFAMFWDAPLLEPANPGMSPNPAKAPWYFMGFQELLIHLHPVFAVFIWPMLGGLFLLAVPFWRNSALPAGIWFGSERGRKLAILTTVSASCLTVFSLLLSDWMQSNAAAGSNTLVTRGFLPTGLVFAVLAVCYPLMVRRFKDTRAEAVMAGMLLMLTVLAVCTVIGIWFRGAEMALIGL